MQGGSNTAAGRRAAPRSWRRAAHRLPGMLLAGAALAAAFAVLLRPAAAADAVQLGLQRCCGTVIPALFPFLVLTNVLMSVPGGGAAGLPLLPYTQLLGVRSRKAPAAVLLGLLGGFAGGAGAVGALADAGEITPAEAQLLLCCSVNAGPGFVVSGVGALLLGSASAGGELLAALCAASLLTGLVMRLLLQRGHPGSGAAGVRSPAVPAVRDRAASENASARASKSALESASAARNIFAAGNTSAARSASAAGNNFAAGNTSAAGNSSAAENASVLESASALENASALTLLAGALRRGVLSTLQLCGTVTFFTLVTALTVPQAAAFGVRFACALGLEVTCACAVAVQSAGAVRIYLCCAALSCMGLSIFAQVRTLVPRGVSLVPLALSRLVHLPLSLLLLRVLLRLFPVPLAAAAQPPAVRLRMPPDALVAVFLLCGAFFLLFPGTGSLHPAPKKLQ